MKIKIILAVAVLLLAACTTSQDALNGLSAQWMGKSADEFFSRYGIPSRQYKMDGGDTLYQWSNNNSVYLPPTTTVTGSVSPVTGQFYGDAVTSGGYNMSLVCVIQFTVGPDKRIKQISVLQDSWGWWETSRCNELFN